MKKNLHIKEKGFAALTLTLILIFVMVLVVSGFSFLLLNEIKIASNLRESLKSYYAAEAGIEDSIYRIIAGKSYDATSAFSVGDGIASIDITAEGDFRVVRSAGSLNGIIRKLQARLKTETAAITFRYGAQVDKGGLTIQPNAKVIGNVYSNGSITGAGTAKSYSATCPGSASCISGDAWVAGGTAPTPNQEWTSQDSDFNFGLRVGSTNFLDTAQSFTSSTSEVLNTVSLYLKKVGSPPDQTVRILTDNMDSPSKTSLSSGTLKSSKITENYSWVDVSFDPPPSLTAGQTYWILIDVSRDDNNYWVWGKDSGDSYPAGTGKYTSKDWNSSNPGDWNSAGGDLNFKTWMGGFVTSLSGIWIGVDAHANTISDSNITRDAYYQSIDGATEVWGTKYPGSADPAIKDLPISYAQIQDWEQAAEAGGVIEGNYNPPNGSTIGPIKINGNLTFPSNGIVIITGPVWVAGNIFAENNVTIKLQDGLSSGYPVIADKPADQLNFGKIEFGNNVITQDSSQGGYLLFISTNKGEDPGINRAILLENNVNKDKAQSIIFSLQGLIKVENNVKFKEISGYGIYLANNAEIVYEQGLINANFSTGPGGGWEIESWKEIE